MPSEYPTYRVTGQYAIGGTFSVESQAALCAYRLADTFSPVHIYRDGDLIATIERS